MHSVIAQATRRYILQSNGRIQRRLLFDWIPDKIKYMVIPDKRTAKEKFIEQTQKEQMRKIDEKIEESIPVKGVFGFLIKSLMRSGGRKTVKELSRLTVDAQEAIGLAEGMIVNDPRVRKTYGDDVQITGLVGMKSDSIMEFKEIEAIEAVASLDGSRKSGTVRLVVQKNTVTDQLRIVSITVNDGHNEFDVMVNHNFSPSSKNSSDARVIDVKARDD